MQDWIVFSKSHQDLPGSNELTNNQHYIHFSFQNLSKPKLNQYPNILLKNQAIQIQVLYNNLPSFGHNKFSTCIKYTN